MAASSSREAAIARIRELFATIDEVGRVIAEEGIDASWHKGGTLRVGMNAAQVEGLRRKLADQRKWGFGEEDYVWLSAEEARARVNVEAALAGHYTPHWEARECVTDGRHLIIYLQRTVDGRIAMGGRGAPYHFGSRVLDSFDGDSGMFQHLRVGRPYRRAP